MFVYYFVLLLRDELAARFDKVESTSPEIGQVDQAAHNDDFR